ncbi:MAG: putative bifunctional diguanylate cyclase/phosphodiesterase [Burkholderiaceae bacterium]
MKTLKSRIATLLLSVLLVMQLISFFVIRSSINTNVSAAVQAEVAQGSRLLNRLLEQKRAALSQITQAMAGDFGFRAAMASADTATVSSALVNHGARSDVDLLGYIEQSGQVMVMIGSEQESLTVPDSMLELIEQGSDSPVDGVFAQDGELVLFVISPVKSPLTIGHVLIGFNVGKTLTTDMKLLAGINASFLVAERSQAGSSVQKIDIFQSGMKLDSTTLESALLPAQSQISDNAFEMVVDGVEYASSLLPIGNMNGNPAFALLQRSIDEAAQPYTELQIGLLLITAIGLLVSIFASVITAHQIADPIRRLSLSARRLGAGERSAVDLRIQRHDEVGELAQAFNAMSEQIEIREQRIFDLAFKDGLTGLPNRAGFLKAADTALESPADSVPYILIMNVRRFKFVNDVLGLPAGDELLQSIGRVLTERLAEAVTVARLGGNEFAVLASVSAQQNVTAGASYVCETVEQSFSIAETAVDVTVAAGVAERPDHASTANEWLARAELALNSAKNGTNRIVVYADELDSRSEISLSMKSELLAAIDQEQLEAYYQPKVHLQTGHVIGAEALIRWHHPDRGFVPPDDFIPFAESSGVVTSLTHYMLIKVVRQLAQWNLAGFRLKVSVNLSTRDLIDRQLPVTIIQMLKDHKVATDQLVLEITESAIIEDIGQALQTLNALRESGLKVSVDDYGTGYSSLAYLKTLPIDELKIDRSFVKNLVADDGDRTIVRSTIALGHDLGLNVVAEGIEDKATADILTEMGCDCVQGYYFGKPMDAQTYAAWLRAWPQAQSSTAAVSLEDAHAES